MNKTVQFALLGTSLAITPAFLAAQMGSPTPNQPSAMQPPNGAAAGTGMAGAMTSAPGTLSGDDQGMKDKMFLRKAAAGGMAEVQLGQLAADKAASADVKAFGQKMVTDHTALNNDMKPIAESLGVMLPKKIKKEDQAEYDKLSALSGDEFDKEYLAYMVRDHHMDLREFREEESSAQDPALKAAVDKGYKVIQQHTSMVEKLARDKGVTMPQRKSPSPTPPSNH